VSSTYAEPLERLNGVLDELAAISPEFRTSHERREFLLGVARAKARIVATEMRVLAASDDIAEETGERSSASWLARHAREAHETVRRHAVLAAALGSRWTRTADALGAGDLNLAQARVIVEALDALPDELGDDLVVKAEAYLVEQATVFGPRELRHLGRGVLEHLAPEVADETEYQLLLAEEQRAQAATRLSFTPRGDGSTDLHARIPDHVANRLRTYLDAYTSPRHTPLGDVDALPTGRRRGEAVPGGGGGDTDPESRVSRSRVTITLVVVPPWSGSPVSGTFSRKATNASPRRRATGSWSTSPSGVWRGEV